METENENASMPEEWLVEEEGINGLYRNRKGEEYYKGRQTGDPLEKISFFEFVCQNTFEREFGPWDGDEPPMRIFRHRYRAKRPDGDYFSTQELIEAFEVSPAQFVGLLRHYKKIIHPYGMLDGYDAIYNDEVEPVLAYDSVKNAKFHFREVELLLKERYGPDDCIKKDVSCSEANTNSMIGGLSILVFELAKSGKTRPQIAKYLKDKGLSLSIIGALLYEGGLGKEGHFTTPKECSDFYQKKAQALLKGGSGEEA